MSTITARLSATLPLITGYYHYSGRAQLAPTENRGEKSVSVFFTISFSVQYSFFGQCGYRMQKRKCWVMHKQMAWPTQWVQDYRQTSWTRGRAALGKATSRKVIKIFATRCQILRTKCTKSFVGWGSAPPQCGSLQRSPDATAGF